MDTTNGRPAILKAKEEMGNSVPAVISDAAKRASDNINAHITFTPRDELMRKWMAIRLSDGSYDGTLYDSKRDAVRHQSNEFLCAYVSFRNIPGGATPQEMEIFLRFNRDAYDAGFRMPDPDDVSGGKEVLMTSAQHDYYRQQLANERDMAKIMEIFNDYPL